MSAEEFARLLAEHDDPPGWTCDDSDAPVFECLCGDRSVALSHDYIYPEDAEDAARWHRAHVAAVLAEHADKHARTVAERAWDEGFRAGQGSMVRAGGEPLTNPYCQEKP